MKFDDDGGAGDVEALYLYEHIVTEAMSGRTEGHKCPVCGEGEIDCQCDDMRVFIKCKKCGRFFEGMIA